MSMRHADQWDSIAALLAASPAPRGREVEWTRAMTFLNAGHRDHVHLVASVLVVDSDGLVLLARHRRYRRWGPLGGHLDNDDASLRAAAARELLEESALVAHVLPTPIDVGLSSYRCRTAAKPVLHLDVCFAASVAASAPALAASDELTGLEWFASRELPNPQTPHTAQQVARAIAAAARPR